jgi:hypothetical protein
MKTEHQDLDAFDRELRALLSVEPSVDLVAGVRARLAEAAPPPVRWRVLVPALAAGLAAVLVARVLTRPAPRPPAPPRAVAAAPRPIVPSPAPLPAGEPGRPPVPPARPAVRPPDVIVEPGQEEALLRFVAARNVRAVSSPSGMAASTALDAPLAPPPPIEIAPLEVPSLFDTAGSPARSDS